MGNRRVAGALIQRHTRVSERPMTWNARPERGHKVCGAMALILYAVPAVAQVDQHLAETYFREAAVLCGREGGKLWGVSLCGPLVVADPATHTIAANQAVPNIKQPAVMGYANMALDWGGTRWSMIAWPMIAPLDEHARGLLMMHELFHRIQPQLGLLGEE